MRIQTIAMMLVAVGLASAADLPFTGTWKQRPAQTVGEIYKLEVRKGVYECTSCLDSEGKVPIDGAEHAVPGSKDTVSARTVGKLGFEIVRKTPGVGLCGRCGWCRPMGSASSSCGSLNR
jgi:hypothetical protein